MNTTTITSTFDVRNCQHCQSEIVRQPQHTPAIWKTVKYCSASCRMAVRPRHPSTPNTGRCLHCDTPIPVSRKYCGDDCQYWALAEKMEQQIDKSSADGCWIWTGPSTQQGYGVAGRTTDGSCVLAHRAAVERQMGRRIPHGLVAAHRCDIPACCNPDHIFLTTQLGNMRDAAAKNRTMKGSRARKLTESQAREIRARYAQGGYSLQMLAAEYNVDAKTIHRVTTLQTYRPKWTNVTVPQATIVAA